MSTMKPVVLRVKASLIHGITHPVFVTSEYCMDSVRNETRPFLDVPTLRHTRRGRDGAGLQLGCDSLWNMRSRALGGAPSEVASLAAPGTRAAGPWGRPRPPPECAPRGHSGPRRARVDPPRAAPRGPPGFQVSSSPGRRPTAPRTRAPTQNHEVRWSADFGRTAEFGQEQTLRAPSGSESGRLERAARPQRNIDCNDHRLVALSNDRGAFDSQALLTRLLTAAAGAVGSAIRSPTTLPPQTNFSMHPGCIAKAGSRCSSPTNTWT